MPSEVWIAGAHHDREPTVEELKRELAESREQQAVTAEILATISSSATDTSQVFAKIAASAARLCDAYDVLIRLVDGDNLHLVAHHGLIPVPSASVVPLSRELVVGRSVLERRTVHAADLAEADDFPESRKNALQFGHRTALCVPLVHAGEAIGVIFIRRAEVRPFTDRQIELVKTFADQAVIAIENTRLFEEVQARTHDLQEALEHQTATSEVLEVISRSPTDVQPVFDMIAQSAARICNARHCNVFRFDGQLMHFAASHGLSSEAQEMMRRRSPVRTGRGSAAGRAIDDNAVAEIQDIPSDAEYQMGDIAKVGDYRSAIAVPMRKDGRPIGAIALTRRETGPFPQRQIDLLKTFADQAVIAIENTRLFEEVEARTSELQQSLERQTATSKVLAVISRSLGELEPVFESLLANAVRICEASFGAMWLREGDAIRNVTFHGALPPSYADLWRSGVIRLDSDVPVARAARSKKTIHIEDMREDPAYLGGHPLTMSGVDAGGIRTMLVVPMFKEDEFIAAMAIYRLELRRFSDKQIELVKSFADQAVIAIDNTRLFEAEQASKRELQESLKYQTAISEVLSVISRSQTEIRPVFDAILESAVRLCGADQGGTGKVENGMLDAINWYPDTPEISAVFRANFPRPVDRSSLVGQAIVEARVLHVPDLEALDDSKYLTSVSKAMGYRSQLTVPLLRSGQPIGVIALVRKAPEAFTDRQIALATTFADQAVIAIENTRLFEEVQARTRELARTVEDLEIASQHKSQFVANMSHELRTPLAAILGYAELMQEGFYEAQGPKSLDALTRIRSNGKHLLGLINTVLDIAKIESGQFTLNMAEYDIESVVETVRSATESLAQNKKLAFKTEVAKPLPIGLGDEQRLTQVLLNLVGNAIKFTDSGEVHVTAKAVNGHFNLSVTDTGPGIPAEHQTRIFDQFHQVDSSNTKAKGGTGLGLAIAKQIVEMHGGRIWVESTLGKGSTFQMQLPTRAEFRNAAP